MSSSVIATYALALLALFAFGCGGSQGGKALSDAERAKLDPTLQRVVAGDTAAAPEAAQARRGAERVYLVLIRTAEPSALREAGLPLGSVSGTVATARLTAAEIRQAARLDAVGQIQISQTAGPTR
jgi:hypothetical protein